MANPFVAHVIPNLPILGTAQADAPDAGAARKLAGHRAGQSWAHVLVEEHLHATQVSSRRSRAAAKARQARMSLKDQVLPACIVAELMIESPAIQ